MHKCVCSNQCYLRNAVGGALQHAIIIRYMLEDDQTEQGATAATWDTQEEWLQPGIPLWVLDSNGGHEGHQQVHAAEAVRENVVTEAPADDTEPVVPAPTLPMQAKAKKTSKVVPTQHTAAGKGTPSSGKKQAKGKEKESDKPAESDDDDANEEEEEEDTEQVHGDPAEAQAGTRRSLRCKPRIWQGTAEEESEDCRHRQCRVQDALAFWCPAVSWFRCLSKWDKCGGKKPRFEVG